MERKSIMDILKESPYDMKELRAFEKDPNHLKGFVYTASIRKLLANHYMVFHSAVGGVLVVT